jgi:uncharacterized protein
VTYRRILCAFVPLRPIISVGVFELNPKHEECCTVYVNHIYDHMDIEFDADKDEINQFKHQLPLAFGRLVFDDPALVLIPTIRIDDEEERWKAVGLVDGKLYTAIHVWRGESVRMTSVRRSNANERRDYDRDPGGSE